ncbi:MAG TPA: serine/threonine-protein kinase [Gemmatales bacterium]|nr:serine/threonine-protein kinase [Gemmatales bacterium]
MTEEALLELVLRTPEAERSALLDRTCEGRPELRARIEGLLKTEVTSVQIISHPPALDATTGHQATGSYTSDDTAGVVIAGRYKLLEEIGEGGMGTVWMAQQSEPVKRQVAIKLIKAGMDSKAVLARFDAERQALAVMDHPNIAKVLDGGVDNGVGDQGKPLTPSPSPQRGEGRSGRPYFVMELVKGIPITRFCDERKLTPRERLELFVPVCHAIQHAHQKGIIHRDIKPSNVLVTLYDDKPVPKVIDFGVAKATGAQLTEQTLNTGYGNLVGTPEYMSPEQATLNSIDIDTRSDIYALGVLLYELLTGSTPVDRKRLKAAALMEVLRMVREEDAVRPSTKLSSSEALPSIAANRHTEPAKLSRILKGELDWIVMKALEKDRTRRYETANGFAADVQRYLCGEQVQAVPPSSAYRLKKFLKKNRGPVLAAGLVALALLGGMIGTTINLFEARRQERLANAAREAEAERAEGERKAKLEAHARQVEAERQKTRAEEGEKRAEEEKKIAQVVRNFLQNKLLRQADVSMQASSLLRSGGKEAVAQVKENPTIRELLDRAAQELTTDKIDTNFPNQPIIQAEILSTVGITYDQIGEGDKAIGFLQRAMALYQQHLGPKHPTTLNSMHHLVSAYLGARKQKLALPLGEETLRLRKATLGASHPDTLESMRELASLYRAIDRLDLAIPLCEETLRLRKAKFGASHPSTVSSMSILALLYKDDGKMDLALPLFEETVRLSKALYGPEHPSTLVSMNHLALTYAHLGKPDLALPLFEAHTRASFKTFAHGRTAGAKLIETYVQAKAFADAEPLLRKSLTIRTQTDPNDWQTFNTQSLLGGSLLGQKKYAEAEPLLLAGYEGLKQRMQTIPPEGNTRLPEALERLIQLYSDTKKPDEVKKWQAEKDKLPKAAERK